MNAWMSLSGWLLGLGVAWRGFSPLRSRFKSQFYLCALLSFFWVKETLFLVHSTLSLGYLPVSNLYMCVLFLGYLNSAFLIFSWLDANARYEQNPLLETALPSCFKTVFPAAALGQKCWQPSINWQFACSRAVVLGPLNVCFYGFAFALPSALKNQTGLIPALQSHWLEMHVLAMLVAYASLFLGCLFSLGFLMLFHFSSSGNKWLGVCDGLSYRLLACGFFGLTLGLLSGAVWANQTWGSYWSWDPKETWALITWFVFAAYLHARLTKGSLGLNPARFATFGFFVLNMCFLGVNLMAKGLHSYGFF